MISLVSGTYNRRELVERMIESARRSAGRYAETLEIIIVDGGSTDGTLDYLRGESDVVTVEHGELRGAIRAYNDGFAAVDERSDVVIIGNDDVVFDGDTIARAADYLRSHPQVGQVAFGHKYQRRGGDPKSPRIQGAFGFVYGQCSAVRRTLGDAAEWWGSDGMRTYGGDTRLSLRLWELGYAVTKLDGCSVVDHEHDDDLRRINSDTPRVGQPNGGHPDLMRFMEKWNGRMPARSDWIPAPRMLRLLELAAAGRLRSMRFKSTMYVGAPMRTALWAELRKLGPAVQVDQTSLAASVGQDEFQDRAVDLVKRFSPDLLVLQAQRRNNFRPETVRRIRREVPWTTIVNFDGDTHYPLEPFHAEIARAVDLQCVVSPTVFEWYARHGIGVGYWPIGIEAEYMGVKRPSELTGPDVLFLGALYGIGRFPEAEFRRDAVAALAKQDDVSFGLYGPGWEEIGLKVGRTSEAHKSNAELMASSKMVLSISQTADLWGYTSDRLYNVCATGAAALVQRFAGMEDHGYTDGVTCIGFSTIEEMLDKARFYSRADAERERIAAAGRKVTIDRHVWERRVETLFTMLDDLSNKRGNE